MNLFLLSSAVSYAGVGAEVPDFNAFAESMFKALTTSDSAFVLQHTQFPLPILDHILSENLASSPGTPAFIGPPRVRVATQESWSKVETCGTTDEIMDTVAIPNLPVWACDLFYTGVLEIPTARQIDSNTYAIVINSSGPNRVPFSMSNPRTSGGTRLVFDYLGDWVMRRVEHVYYAE